MAAGDYLTFRIYFAPKVAAGYVLRIDWLRLSVVALT